MPYPVAAAREHAMLPYSPKIEPALKWWVSADVGAYVDAGVTLATNGQQVQQLNDQGPAGKHASQATLARRPTYVTNVLNGKPVLRWSAADAAMSLITAAFAAALAQPTTIYAVCSVAALAGARGVVDGVANRTHIFENALTSAAHIYAGVDLTQNAFAVGGFKVLCARYNGANSSLSIAGVVGTPGNAGAASMDAVTLGNNFGLSAAWNGDIAELFVVNALHSTADEARVLGYFKGKYGL